MSPQAGEMERREACGGCRRGRLLGGNCCVSEVRASAEWAGPLHAILGTPTAVVSNSRESNLWSIRVSASSHVPTQWPSGVGQLVAVKSWVPLTLWFPDGLPRRGSAFPVGQRPAPMVGQLPVALGLLSGSPAPSLPSRASQ